jgi:EmrB/QacA subfamily drug resistance transporter
MSADQAPTAARAPVGRRLDPGVRRIASVVILGSIMSILDATIVNVALESLSRDLHTRLDTVQWVVTAYLLSLAAAIPVTAWAARRLGPKRLYIISIVLFTLGSALCGLATSTGELIAFRVIQGVGGGMIMPVGQMIMVRAAGPRNLTRVMSAIGVPIVLAPVLGPTVGGLLLDSVGWRWIFFVNLPIGVAAVIAAVRKLPAYPAEDAGPFDLPGLGLIASGLVLVTYGLAEVGASPGHSAQIIFPLALGGVLIAAFVVRALRMESPLLDMRLYANKEYSAATVTMFCFGAALFGGMILMPLYFQTVRGESALYTGLLLAPRGIGAAMGTWTSGRATDRLGAGATTLIGGLIALVSNLPLVMIGSTTSYWVICGTMTIGGFGLGLGTTPAMTAAYRTLRPRQVHDAAPQLNIIMRVGGSLGTAILTVVLQDRLARAGGSLPAQARAFGSTFWWVLAVTAAAVVPPAILMLVERRQALAAAALAGPGDPAVAGPGDPAVAGPGDPAVPGPGDPAVAAQMFEAG